LCGALVQHIPFENPPHTNQSPAPANQFIPAHDCLQDQRLPSSISMRLPMKTLRISGGFMYLQGNLQNIFDALYLLGVIDPVLEMDWAEAIEQRNERLTDYIKVVNEANLHQSDVEHLKDQLSHYDDDILSFLAMEVAREFADFHSRENTH
jgi:hypothetical protein